MLIRLNKRLRNWFFFDENNQQLRANQDQEGEYIGRYTNCKKISLDFLECLESVFGKVDLSQGFRLGDKHHRFTMEPPSPATSAMHTLHADHI